MKSGTHTPIRIGFITDLAGAYEPVDGAAGAAAIRMAIDEIQGAVAGRSVQLMTGDHRNDTIVATQLASQWLAHEGVDVIVGGVNSSTSLAIAKVAHELKKPFIVVGAGTTAHTREQRSPYVIQYAYDTFAHGSALARGLIDEGAKSWFFVTAEYPFGVQLQDAAVDTIAQLSGTVVGTARHPYATEDFTAFIATAKDSGAEVIGFANAHTEVINALRAARVAGLPRSTRLAATFAAIDDVHEAGLQDAQGLYVSDSWFWTRDEGTRAWSRRFFDITGRMPSSLHAADYSAAKQFLRAVAAVGSSKAEPVLANLRSARFDDMYVKSGYVRADGRMIHDMYVLQVKPPAEVSEPWDYYRLVTVVPGELSALPMGGNRADR